MRKTEDFDKILGDAESALNEGLRTLTQWGEQAREILQNRPGAVLASVSLAGFMTGLLLREGRAGLKKNPDLKADPVILFVSGAIAGWAFGPKIMRDLGKREQRPAEAETFQSRGKSGLSAVSDFDKE